MRRADLGKRTDGDGQFATCSPSGVASRKADHVRINLEEDVAAKGIASGFDDYEFLHCALPELNLDRVDSSTELFGRRLSAPLLISCMVGGTDEAASINRVLAQVAQRLGVAMGLGSGRILLEDPDVLRTFDVRRVAPDVLLFANLGAVQLNKGYGVDHCRRLVDALGADALVLHLNALQEAVQPEGDTCFAGLLGKIGELCRRLEVPVVAKEVGWGIAPDAVRLLLDAGVAAVDVAGAGGTSWSEVERRRITEPWRARVAAAFAGWGIPTAECLRQARQAAPEASLFASGGIRNGIDIAKAVALGADLVGIAGPFLRTAAEGEEAALDLGRELIETLRIAMFSLGARTLADLRFTPRLRRRDADRDEPHIAELSYRTEGAGQFLDITDDVSAVVRSSGVRRGLAHVYAMHTTAAIRMNENERLLLQDFRRFLDRLAPAGDGAYEHDDLPRRPDVPPDEPMNGHAHCRHLLLSTSEMVPILDGRLELGRWQRIFLIELCTARERRVMVQVLGR
ncbi:MAG TPA: type 2 isopentenyl-diphosphate Delta-isomerase [bacterium]|nr:type 2 isopentenyl-diphosphate Delta-isomerase [bacterium]